MEEVLEAEFEEVNEEEKGCQKQCVGEPFQIFSDEEGGDEIDDGPQFISRLVPLEEVARGTDESSGSSDQAQIREEWLAAKQQEIAEAKGKVIR